MNLLSNRVKALEQKHSLGVPSDFESRLAALELKCRNIQLSDEPVVLQDMTTSFQEYAVLTLEQRLEILEHKLRNIT